MKVVLKATDDKTGTPVFRSVSARALPRPQLVVVDIPVNISDQVERPNRKRIKVRNLGETIYQELKQKEGDSVTLELYSPQETIRGVVESVAYPVINDANISSGLRTVQIIFGSSVTYFFSISMCAGHALHLSMMTGSSLSE